MTKIYKITTEEAKNAEKVYFDYLAHKSIVKEIAISNPETSIADYAAYNDYVVLMKKYDNYINQLINKYAAGEYVPTSKWEIRFEEAELIITTSDES